MPHSTHSSDISAAAHSEGPVADQSLAVDHRGCGRATRSAAVIALEGMPGAGKTTLATTLSRHGHLVVPEYAAVDGSVIVLEQHPNVHADDAHQRNWLRKHQLVARTAGRHAEVVWVDRDWVTALAYAYSLDDQLLLAERAAWAARHLATGRLAVAAAYLVLHLGPAASLRRREGHLDPSHPWSQPGPLRRLAEFYQDPAGALAATAPEIAVALNQASWIHLAKPSPRRTVAAAAELLRNQRGNHVDGGGLDRQPSHRITAAAPQ